jgi:hypothetical protein
MAEPTEAANSVRAEYALRRADWALRESRASWSRLAIFVALVVAWVFLWSQPWIAAAATVVGAVAFALAVRTHHRARDQREQADRLLLMTAESGRRAAGVVTLIRSCERPADDAAVDEKLPALVDEGRFWELTNQERDDLDLFARPVGIFGLLNRTSTALGARRLRDMLDRPLLSPERIRARQSSARWLAENTGARDEVMAGCAALRNEDKRLARTIEAVHSAKALKLFAPVATLRGWSAVSLILALASLGLSLAGQWNWGTLGGAVLTINMVLYVLMRTALSPCIEPWLDTAWAVRGLEIAARHAAAKLPDEGELGDLRRAFHAVAASPCLPSLHSRVGWAERGGGMHVLFNVVGFYDLHVAAGLVACVVPHRAELLRAIAALGRLEALCSLACFAAEQPIRSVPDFSDAREIEIKGGVHPLVTPTSVIGNDVRLDSAARIWIVTGSNMAGKSTFLRMVGVNTLLAQIGAMPTVRAMRLTPLRLISDLRARDNLAESESYFLSEVRHLRRMITPPPGEEAILGLIDEPFRGTNSQDQTAASVAVVRHLLASGHLFLLATHDRHLTTLADGRAATNFHFRENLGSDGLVFDYKLHDGPATTRNALRILEHEGYPASLLADAHAWLERKED